MNKDSTPRLNKASYAPDEPGQLLSVGSQPPGGKMAEAAHHDQAAPREVTGATGVRAEDLSEDALQIPTPA